jgi:HTH-like domain
MPLQGSLSIERMCQLAGVSRAGFYRSLQDRAPVEEDMEVRSVIQQIAVEHRRRYGYRRISAELRRRGMLVNHKRVSRIMRKDNLLAVQPRAFVVTTDSDHRFEVYLNLASRMKLTGINQLWVADITYIRLKKEFVYLAVVLRRVLTQGGGMGAGPHAGGPVADRSAGTGYRQATTSAGSGASFGSRGAVRVRRLRPGLATAPDDPQYESLGEPVRQRQLRKLSEDAQTGRDLCPRLS